MCVCKCECVVKKRGDLRPTSEWRLAGAVRACLTRSYDPETGNIPLTLLLPISMSSDRRYKGSLTFTIPFSASSAIPHKQRPRRGVSFVC